MTKKILNITFTNNVNDIFSNESEKTFLKQYNPTDSEYVPFGKTSLLNSIKSTPLSVKADRCWDWYNTSIENKKIKRLKMNRRENRTRNVQGRIAEIKKLSNPNIDTDMQKLQKILLQNGKASLNKYDY